MQRNIILISAILFMVCGGSGQNLHAENGPSIQQGQTHQQSRKTDTSTSTEMSESNKKTEELRKSISDEIARSKNESIKKSTQQQLSMVREKSKIAGTTAKRNVSAEVLAAAYGVLKSTPGSGAYLRLLQGVTPARYGLASARNTYEVDKIKDSYLSQQANAGGPVSSGAAAIRADALNALYLGAWLADAVAQIQSESLDMDDALGIMEAWLRSTAPAFVAGKYSPSDRMYGRYQDYLSDSGEVLFAGSRDKYKIGPALVDLSSGVFGLRVAGKPYLATDGLGGLNAEISYATNYSIKDTLNDIESVDQLREITKSVKRAIADQESHGQSRDAQTNLKTYASWAMSLSDQDDFGVKLQLLLNMLKL